MKFQKAQTLAELARLLSCQFVGQADFKIHGINEIHRAEEGDLVFVDHPKYYDVALNSRASAVLIDKELSPPEGKVLLISKKVFSDFNTLIKIFQPEVLNSGNIHPSAVIDPEAYIAPGVVVGANVRIGKGSVIMPNVVIYANTSIGERVRVHANTSLGSDAFYYQKKEGIYHKFHSCGELIIEDDVEIGASCTIDRGVSHKTIIGAGSKLDNHIHIGHDTIIGKRCLFAAQVGVAGCVEIGDDVTLWGQVGVAANIRIGDKVTVYAQSGISKDLEAGKTYFGSPASEARAKFKELAALKQLLEKKS